MKKNSQDTRAWKEIHRSIDKSAAGYMKIGSGGRMALSWSAPSISFISGGPLLGMNPEGLAYYE